MSGLDWTPLYKNVTVRYKLPFAVEGSDLSNDPSLPIAFMSGPLKYQVTGLCSRRKLQEIARSDIIERFERQIRKLAPQTSITR